MKILISTAILGFALLQTSDSTLSPADAAKHAGEQATVCGQITGQHTASSAKGRPTFYDMGGRFPNSTFTVLVWGDNQAAVGDLPSDVPVCVSGKVELFKGKAEIVLRDAASWKKQ